MTRIKAPAGLLWINCQEFRALEPYAAVSVSAAWLGAPGPEEERMPRRSRRTAEGDQPDLGSVSETAGGIPDDAIGPDQRSVAELLDLEQGQDVEAMAAKLQAEADARRVATHHAPRGKADGGWGD
jgi:hypothetical protein